MKLEWITKLFRPCLSGPDQRAQRKKLFDRMRSTNQQVLFSSVEGSPLKKEEHRMKLEISRMLDHLSETSVFDRSVPALFLILGISLAFTLLHTVEEWKGRGGPLWRNFGAIVGVRIPNWLGFLSFFLILTSALWLVSLVAITGDLLRRTVHTKYAAGALGGLIGARLGDTTKLAQASLVSRRTSASVGLYHTIAPLSPTHFRVGKLGLTQL
jgi:hypothetical protein